VCYSASNYVKTIVLLNLYRPPKPSKVHNKLEDYPLHNCAAMGDAEGIVRLLDSGWSVTQKDADLYTPIHYAAK